MVALSQTDPRKALAELVQNSLDADSERVHVVRFRHRGAPCLRVFDNGRGVIPELDRPDALRYIATHIGHSRKRSLSPQERLALMTQGQYGIGLLGFWCLGQSIEIRSAVAGQTPHRLILYRDRSDYAIEPLRGRLPLGDCWTEVVVANLHPEASRAVVAGRIKEYLAAELRGQLLAREVDLVVDDAMARGRARRSVHVRPRRFLGERLEGVGPIEVPGHPPIHFEIYYTGAAIGTTEEGPLSLYCAGSLVAESFHELAALGLDHLPWIDPRLTGFIEYSGFQVAPGTRRGIVPDESAEAFVRGLARARLVLERMLEGFERRRMEELDRTLVRDLQRAFRDFYRQRPAYALLPVGSEGDRAAGPADPDGAQGNVTGGGTGLDAESGADAAPDTAAALPAEAGAQAPAEAREGSTIDDDHTTPEAVGSSASPDSGFLVPPGPLSTVRIVPALIRAKCATQRAIRAEALDATGRIVEEAVAFTWTLEGPIGEFEVDVSGDAHDSTRKIEPRRVIFTVGGGHGDGNESAHREKHIPSGVGRVTLRTAAEPAEGTLQVRAVAMKADAREMNSPHAGLQAADAPVPMREAEAEAPVEILEELPGRRSSEGIPEPELVDQPAAAWRSRMEGRRWQVNAAHRDYRTVADQPRLKLRYLAMLFA
ncbi:MAG: ATP-binding protein, partial [Candidatus Eisenbacteria bacterium]